MCSCDNTTAALVTTQAQSAKLADVTTEEPSRETPIQRFRTPLAAWLAFGAVCQRRRIARSRRLFDLMWGDVRRHGTEQERAAFAIADKELRERRSRRPRSPG